MLSFSLVYFNQCTQNEESEEEKESQRINNKKRTRLRCVCARVVYHSIPTVIDLPSESKKMLRRKLRLLFALEITALSIAIVSHLNFLTLHNPSFQSKVYGQIRNKFISEFRKLEQSCLKSR